MSRPDLAALREQYAQQTVRWNDVKARMAAMGSRRVAVPRAFVSELAELCASAPCPARLPRFATKA